MKLYITTNSELIIKKYYLKKLEKNYEIINIPFMASHLLCQEYKTDNFQKFILTTTIEKKIIRCHKCKKIKTVIYIMEEINIDYIEKLYSFLEEKNIYFTEKNLIDYYGKINPNLYLYFNNII